MILKAVALLLLFNICKKLRAVPYHKILQKNTEFELEFVLCEEKISEIWENDVLYNFPNINTD